MAIDPRIVDAQLKDRSVSCKTCGDEKKILSIANGTSLQASVMLPASLGWEKLTKLRRSTPSEMTWSLLLVLHGPPLSKHVTMEFGNRAKGIVNAYATEIACPDCMTYRVVQLTHTEDATP